jgi:hypothetical protein
VVVVAGKRESGSSRSAGRNTAPTASQALSVVAYDAPPSRTVAATCPASEHGAALVVSPWRAQVDHIAIVS